MLAKRIEEVKIHNQTIPTKYSLLFIQAFTQQKKIMKAVIISEFGRPDFMKRRFSRRYHRFEVFKPGF